jgi:hypothetical protein
MKRTFDTKSLLLGVLFGGALTALLGAASQPNQAVGRYQVSVGAERSIVIDTATGQLWERTEFGTQKQRSDPDFDKMKSR